MILGFIAPMGESTCSQSGPPKQGAQHPWVMLCEAALTMGLPCSHEESHADGSDPVYMAWGGHTQVTGVDLVNRGIHTVLKKLYCLCGRAH